jgi:hypothetical protein
MCDAVVSPARHPCLAAGIGFIILFLVQHEAVVVWVTYAAHVVAGLLLFEQVCLLAGIGNRTVGVLAAVVVGLLLLAQQAALVIWPTLWATPFLTGWAAFRTGRRLVRLWKTTPSR